MSNYCTLEQVKELAGIETSDDDTLLAELITRASAMVDSYTRRQFAERTETRYYTPNTDTTGQILYLDDDLLSITTLLNGDDAEISAEGYTLLPLNFTPKNRVKLKSNYSWVWAVEDSEGALSVTGQWGYCFAANCPADIVHVTTRLSVWLYRQKDAPFNRVGNSLTGEYEVPTALPADIKAILNLYRKPVMGVV